METKSRRLCGTRCALNRKLDEERKVNLGLGLIVGKRDGGGVRE